MGSGAGDGWTQGEKKMENFKKVRTAVVGCGMISGIYLENMSRSFSIFEVVGCCDKNEQAAAAKAKTYGLKALKFEEILQDETIELVINLTSPAAHYQVVKALLLAGKNVYTEKILAVGWEESEELARIAAEKELFLGVAPDTFLGSGIQTARQMAESGIIGEVTSCFAAVNRDYRMLAEHIPFITKPGGGIGFDVGIYYMTALVSILGAVRQASGFVRTLRKNRRHEFVNNENYGEPYVVENENLMAGSLVFESGVLGNVHFNSESIPEERPRLVLYGTEGILYMPDPNQFGGEVKVVRRGCEEPFAVQQNFGYSGNSRGLGAAEMAWSIRNGRVPRANKEMALNALEALHGIAVSSQTGAVYTLKSTFEKAPPLPQGYIDKYGNAEEALAK